MIYGANGYTGELIAREAVRRGHHPLLAGRDAKRIGALSRELALDARVFDLGNIDLSGVAAVLHCAGPFLHTSPAMVRACRNAGVHYLDVTGEIAVFESILRLKESAVTLLPGVGFDVVPTDCLAAMLKERLPDAQELILAFYMRGASISRGTAKTMLEGIGYGGAIRRDGKIVRVPAAYDAREIPFSCGTRMAMTIPWGDVSTAFYTTGIPNIRVYSATHPKTIRRVQRFRRLLPLAKRKPVQRVLQALASRKRGSNEQQRESGRSYLWGCVSNAGGESVTLAMEVAEGYAFTVQSSLNAIERLLGSPARPGSFTPARYFGADFVFSVPATKLQ